MKTYPLPQSQMDIFLEMMRYPQMKFIMEKVVELYPVYAPQMQLEVMAGQPAH